MLWRFFLQRIPKKFISKYGVDLSNMAFLTVPNGTKWKVKLTKRDGEVCFQNGWCESASCHALNPGHLLVFKYEGNSHFYVLIFDATATEIDYPLDDQQEVHRMEDIESDDNSLEIMDGFMPSQKRREKSPLPCPLPHKRAKTNPRSSDLQAGGGDTHFRPELTKSKGSMLEKSKMNAGVSFTRRESKGLNLILLFRILILTRLLFHISFFHIHSTCLKFEHCHITCGLVCEIADVNEFESISVMFL